MRFGRKMMLMLAAAVLAVGATAFASRFNGGGCDGYDEINQVVPFVGKDRFHGGSMDGQDDCQDELVLPCVVLSLATTNITIEFAGARSNTLYSLYACNSNFAGSATLLYEVSNVAAFAFTDTNALGSVDRRFYRITETLSGVVSTNLLLHTAFRRQLVGGAWTKLGLGLDFGQSNRLDSTLGLQIAQGLTGRLDKAEADLFYLLDSEGNWQIAYLDNNGRWRDFVLGNLTNTPVAGSQSFWIKRKNGDTSNPVYYGPCFVSPDPVTFQSNEWQMITWPLPWERGESGGTNQGWGFSAAGARGGTGWLNSDLLTVGDGAALRFYYLNTNGRWCAVGQSSPASSVTLRPGDACYYLHRGTGFVWTATAQ